MGLSFKNSPLVEIIAELQWDLPWVSQSVQESGTIVSMPGSVANQHEEFYMRFGSKVAAVGFQRIERLVPPHFPQLPYQPVYRFRPSSEDVGTRIYQLGAGIFSTNATPPYKSWAEFEPVLSVGVDALLQSWSDGEKLNKFISVKLRYIDAFRKDLSNGLSTMQFMELLGLNIKMPEALTRPAMNKEGIQPLLQLTIPVALGWLNISIADGMVSNESAIIIDTTASKTLEVESSKEKTMQVFNDLHSLIHEMFVELTVPLHKLMQPEDNTQC